MWDFQSVGILGPGLRHGSGVFEEQVLAEGRMLMERSKGLGAEQIGADSRVMGAQ